MDDIPPFESRFLPPSGWTWQFFTNVAGKKLRFGMVMPPDGAPDGIVVGLQGLSEFTEKYFETAHDMLARNLGFCMLDWRGHGKSDRFLDNPHRRHSNGFDQDVADLHHFITGFVQPVAQRGGKTVPLIMLAHSMGGNIGLRYLHDYPETFTAAAFSAPLIAIKALRAFPVPLMNILTASLKAAVGEWYIFGGGDWQQNFRDEAIRKTLSRDPVRSLVHNNWCLYDPALQVGNITYGWLAEAFASCLVLQKPGVAAAIKIPCLFALAGHESLVDNDAIRHFSAAMPQATVIDLPDSYHEILMERDESRNEFLNTFDKLLGQNHIAKRSGTG